MRQIMGQAEWDRQTGTSRTEKEGQDSQGKTYRALLPGQDYQDKTARKGRPGQDSEQSNLNRMARKK
jgi:hypothetical protein